LPISFQVFAPALIFWQGGRFQLKSVHPPGVLFMAFLPGFGQPPPALGLPFKYYFSFEVAVVLSCVPPPVPSSNHYPPQLGLLIPKQRFHFSTFFFFEYPVTRFRSWDFCRPRPVPPIYHSNLPHNPLQLQSPKSSSTSLPPPLCWTRVLVAPTPFSETVSAP